MDIQKSIQKVVVYDDYVIKLSFLAIRNDTACYNALEYLITIEH